MEEKSPDTIVESRKELMISPTANVNSKPFSRTAHFLKPSLSLNGQPISLPFPSLPPTFDPKNWPLTVNFHGWRNSSKNWKQWVAKMAALHADTWKKSGIFEAIFNSTYEFHTNSDLILGVAERWLPDTNSFVFPWGEATVTLEDMLIAGYSVLGSPVFEPLETEESKDVQQALVRERKKVIQTPANKACQAKWLKVFMDSGSQIEHEAFLSLWLSRFVLPTSRGCIHECVFPIAIHLARGTRISLAPAVLATIYRDLTLLKQKIVSLTTLGADDDKLVATTYAPFQLVLIWVWERFLKLSPKPKGIKIGEPRFAQWNNAKCNVKNVRSLLDASKLSFNWFLNASKLSFNWRPYTKPLKNWDFPKFYREEGMWVFSDTDLDDDLLSFITCLRVSELVGLESKFREQYLPHRVARQFGFDQDVPGFVVQSSGNSKDAWSRYIRPVGDVKCFIPSCLFEKDDVTTRYLDWWNTSEFHRHSNFDTNVLKVKKSLNITKEDNVLQDDGDKKSNCELISPPQNLESKPIIDHLNLPESFAKSSKMKQEIGEINNQPVPPGFPSKRGRVQVEDYGSSEEDNLTIAKIMKLKQKKDVSSVNGGVLREDVVDHENVRVGIGECQSHSSSVAGNDQTRNELEAKNVRVKEKEDVVESANQCGRASLGDSVKKNINANPVEVDFQGLERRIARVEKIIAARKALLNR